MALQKRLVVGMVGVGLFGEYRRGLMRKAGVFRVAAVHDRIPEYMAAAAKTEKATPYESYEAMLEHPGLEAVVVCTDLASHARYALAALKKGLHVFVEKHVCCSLEEAALLREAQRKAGLVVGVGHNEVSQSPIVILVQQYIREGKLGSVTAVEVNNSHSGGLRPRYWKARPDKAEGGMLFYCGIDDFYRLQALFGKIAEVSAIMRYDVNPLTETADASLVLFRHRSGVVGTLNNFHTTGYCHKLRIFGTGGNLYIDTHTRQAWYQPCLDGKPEPCEKVPFPVLQPAAVYGNLLSWYNGIRHGAPVSPSLEDGLAVLTAIFAVEESARTGKRVVL